MFVEECERLNQRGNGFLDSVSERKVGEESRQDGDQGQSCRFSGSLGALQIDLETLYQQGLEGG